MTAVPPYQDDKNQQSEDKEVQIKKISEKKSKKFFRRLVVGGIGRTEKSRIPNRRSK